MKKILIFGGSGQIGRHLIGRLTKQGYLVTVVTRNLHQKGSILKTQGNPGYLNIVEANIFDEKELDKLIKQHNICINLVGILFEKKKNSFNNIHINLPNIISQKCNEHNIEQFIHVSALGIEKAFDSKYAMSKQEGEKKIISNFSKFTILRPSIIYSVDDNFTTNFMTMLNWLPAFPLYYKGKTKFTPLHVKDLSEIIFEIIERKLVGKTIECIGPEVLSFKEIILKLLGSIYKKRILIPIPLTLAKLTAKFFELMPKPLLTIDQLNLLKYDNVASGKYKTNFDLGLNAYRKFDNEIEKYSYNWRSGGQFSKKDISNIK